MKVKSKKDNATKSTFQWLRVYLSWEKLRNEDQKMKRLEPSRLDEILWQFYAEVKRKDGTNYKPSSSANMQVELDCRPREASYVYSLLTSRYFVNSRTVLEGKASFLREQRNSKCHNKSCCLSNDEIEHLWQSGQFGYHSPMTLINTLWWLSTLQMTPKSSQREYRRFYF